MNRYERRRQHITLVDFDRSHAANPEFIFDTEPGDVVLAVYMVRNYNPGNSRVPGMRTMVYRDSNTNEYTGLWFAMAKGGKFRVAYVQAAAAYFGAMVLRPAVPVKGICSVAYSNVLATAQASHLYAKRGVNALLDCGALSSASEGAGDTVPAFNQFIDRADFGDEVGTISFVQDPERWDGATADIQTTGMTGAAYEQRYMVSVR